MIRKIEDARSLAQRASGFLIVSVLSIICLATCGAYAHADTLDTSANASIAATEASAAFTEKAGALGQDTNDLVAQDQAVGDQAVPRGFFHPAFGAFKRVIKLALK